MLNEIEPKDIVIYQNQEIGIVKSVNQEKQTAFVVYNCAGKWKEIENYTAACTSLSDLEKISIHDAKAELYKLQIGGVRITTPTYEPPSMYSVDNTDERQAILNKFIEVYNFINNN